MTFPLPIRTAGDTAAEHVDDHNEIHGILGGGLPTGLTTSSTGHLANHNTIHTTLNATEGQSLPTGIVAGVTGHLSHHNTIHTLLNEAVAPSSICGPTAGAQSVRDGAGPRTVTDPGGGISFNSSSALQTAINANPSGSTFVCSTNSPTWNSGVNTGTKAPTIIFPGTVGQCVIDGGFADGRQMINCGNGTTVIGGTWRNIGTTYDFAHGFLTADNCTVRDVVVHDAYGKGIAVQGQDNQVSYSRFHDCGRYGLTGMGSGGTSSGLNVHHCEIDSNNTRDLDGGDAAGGTKFNYIVGGAFRFNYVHDNHGFGFWPDTGNLDWVIEENVMELNHFSGLMFEANHGTGSVLQHNYVANNGVNIAVGATLPSYVNCVNVRLSDDNCDPSNKGQFQYNLVDHTGTQSGILGGLFVLWDHTGTSGRSAQNWDIHDNQFWLRGTTTPRIGGRETGAGLTGIPVWSSNNDFFSNEYHVASMSATYWEWGTGTGAGSQRTYAAWQGFHPGEDVARVAI